MVTFATTLLVWSLWQFFTDPLQSDFQVINRMELRLDYMVLFQNGAPVVIVHSSGFKSGEFGAIDSYQ